ncbi:MmyB family transcriptional regulator [Streptomyces sp. NPDC055078]
MYDLSREDELLREIIEGERKDRHLTQKQMAGTLKVSDRTYRNWIARPTSLSADQVDRIATALNVDEEQRSTLYMLTGLVPPGMSAERLKDTPEMAVYQRMINYLPYPSVVYDYAWDIVITNPAFAPVFGGVRHHPTAMPRMNTTRYVLFHPDAFHILGGGDYEAFQKFWLMPALVNFSATLQTRPEDRRLLTIEREIKTHPTLRRAYRQAPTWLRRHGDMHIDSRPRPVRDPRTQQLTHVHVITEAHQGYQPMTLQRATFIFPSTLEPGTPSSAGRQFCDGCPPPRRKRTR